MSTPNPTHIIAEGMREAATEGRKGTPGTREDGQLWGAFPNTMTLTDLAAHVVSKLTDAGYSIVQLPKPDGKGRWRSERWGLRDDGWLKWSVGLDENHIPFASARRADGLSVTAIAEYRAFAGALLAAAAAAEGERA